MKVFGSKGSVVLSFGFAVALAGGRFAPAEKTEPAMPFTTPEAAMASASSPAAFAHAAGEATIFLPLTSTGDSSPVNVADDPGSLTGVSTSALPEAPQPAFSTATTFGPQTAGQAPHYAKYIPSGWSADKITAHDKVIIGLRDLYSPLNFLAIVFSAGYSHATNGEPNYGTNGDAFAKRVGAAAIRETSQGIFTDMVFAPMLHEDPRYFVEGSNYGFVHRTLYSITRPIVTRTDSGHSSVNGALLLGYAVASAITPAYYPQINRNFHDTASTFGGSVGGAAVGYFVSEFADELLKAVHMKK